MADKGKQQRKQYAPSELMQGVIRMGEADKELRDALRRTGTFLLPDSVTAEYRGTPYFNEYEPMRSERQKRDLQRWLQGAEAIRRAKQADTMGLSTLADIADIGTGGGKQYLAGEVIGKTLSALGINPVEHVVNYAMQNPEGAGLAAAAFGGRKLRNAGKAAAAEARTLKSLGDSAKARASASAKSLLDQQLIDKFNATKSNQDLQDMAAYTAGKDYDKRGRFAIDTQIGVDQGVNAASGGGMGMRGSASLAGVSELAAGVLENPEFYRKQANETWPQFTERLVNATKGLGMKTGGFGGVMQAPGEATVAPMDLHMARNFLPVVLEHPVLGDKFRNSAVQNWNKQLKKNEKVSEKVRSYDELIAKEEGQKFAYNQIIKQVNQTKSAVTMKKGQPNPDVPEHLRNIPGNPKKVKMYGDNYNAMLDENARLAAENGLGVFAEQWRLWDGIRNRVEPHELMRPDLHKLPRLSASELMRAHEAHKAAGYAGKGGVRPTDWKQLFYYSAPPVGLGLLDQYQDQGQAEPTRE